ncbi:40S ribosomal protein S14 [Cucumispora dikerogammari]|nr:40S ribosomal protein S14 [Cucumispora dikerogammari]
MTPTPSTPPKKESKKELKKEPKKESIKKSGFITKPTINTNEDTWGSEDPIDNNTSNQGPAIDNWGTTPNTDTPTDWNTDTPTDWNTDTDYIEPDQTLDTTNKDNLENIIFGIAYIKSTKNDTKIHITDLTGSETIAKSSGGMKVKAHRDESSPYAAMLAAQDVALLALKRGINAVHIKISSQGGNGSRALGPGGQSAMRSLIRNGLKLGTVEDCTGFATDGTKIRGGRRGRRL